MSVKERIYSEIDSMGRNELALLYEQIKFLKRVRSLGHESKKNVPIEEIHRYTSSSKTSWAETVSNDREERI